MNKVFSFYDNKGKLYVDCTECTRGVNGTDEDKCLCGYKTKKPQSMGCFIGEVLPSIDLTKAELYSYPGRVEVNLCPEHLAHYLK